MRLTQADLMALEASCRNGHTVLMKRRPSGRETHIVRHQGTAMIAVYEPRDGRIVTFLLLDDPEARRQEATAPRQTPLLRTGSRRKAFHRRPRYHDESED